MALKRKILRKLINSAKQNILHIVIGANLAVIGIMLLVHHHYFFWPPQPEWITAAENDSVVGFVGLVTGVGLISWAFDEKKPIELNRILVSTASAYYAFLSATELLHGLFSPQGVPNMMTAGVTELALLLVTLYMAKISPTKEDDDK